MTDRRLRLSDRWALVSVAVGSFVVYGGWIASASLFSPHPSSLDSTLLSAASAGLVVSALATATARLYWIRSGRRALSSAVSDAARSGGLPSDVDVSLWRPLVAARVIEAHRGTLAYPIACLCIAVGGLALALFADSAASLFAGCVLILFGVAAGTYSLATARRREREAAVMLDQMDARESDAEAIGTTP
jgi:hypothetical protein